MKKIVPLKFMFGALVSFCIFIDAQAKDIDQVKDKDQACVKGDADCRLVGDWEFGLIVGLGGRTNPLVNGDDQPIILVPQFSWYGEHFFVENFEFGFTFIDKPAHMFNFLVQPGFDHIYFDDISLGNFTLDLNLGGGGYSGAEYISNGPSITDGSSDDPSTIPLPGRDIPQVDLIDDIKSRKIAFLGGFEYSYYRGNWQNQIQALSDVSGVHGGNEFRISSAYHLQNNSSLYTFAVGLAWQSEALLDYYYGIDQGEIDSAPTLAFEAKAGVSGFAKFSWEKKLNDRWSLLSTLQYRKLDSSLVASPLVEESGVATAFIGGSYHF